MKTQQTIIFGCGNTLLGDDGFGPAVIEALHKQDILPESAQAIDAGTGIREQLIDYLLLPTGRPHAIIILDAVDFQDSHPGQLMEIDPSSIPASKTHDFSLHQFPTVNLLQELKEETGIDVRILAAQIKTIPDHIAPGLSQVMEESVEQACAKIMHMLHKEQVHQQ